MVTTRRTDLRILLLDKLRKGNRFRAVCVVFADTVAGERAMFDSIRSKAKVKL